MNNQVSNQVPSPIPLNSLVPTILEGTAVIMMISYNNSQYQRFEGSDAANLPPDILNKLYIEKITARMEIKDIGVFPVLVIFANDKVQYINIDLQSIFNMTKRNEDNEQKETDSDS